MSNKKFNEKDLEKVIGGLASGINWYDVGFYILDNWKNDPRKDELEPAIPELERYCSPQGAPADIQNWVFDHYAFRVVLDAMKR